MLRRLLHGPTGIAAGVLACLPGLAIAQGPQPKTNGPVPLFTPTVLDSKQVTTWSRNLIERIDTVWSETKPAEREQKLIRLAEDTPGELAFVTRVLKRHDANLTSVMLTALKDVFAVLRRTAWQEQDTVPVQRVIAGWSILIPEIVQLVARETTQTETRRLAEAVLASHAALSHDARFGSAPAQQAWQRQLTSVVEMTRHAKPTIRLAGLNILESLGPDARPASAAVVQALGDGDRFVRWAAVQALKAMGMDRSALEAVATLQRDDDPDVRQCAITVVLAQPGGSDLLVRSKNAVPVRRASLDQPTPKRALRVMPASEQPPPVEQTRQSSEEATRPPTPAEQTRYPERPTLQTVEATRPQPQSPIAPVAKPAVSRPTEPAAPGSLRHIFTSSTPATPPTTEVTTRPPTQVTTTGHQEHSEAKLVPEAKAPPAPAELKAKPDPLPLVKTVSKATEAVPVRHQASPVPPSIVTKQAEVRPSSEKTMPAQQLALAPPAPARPMLAPPEQPPASTSLPPKPVPLVAKSPVSRPAPATVPSITIDVTEMWTRQLASTSADAQVRALRELAKFKQGAGHCVPQIAELLIKGEVTVRRQVPLVLMQIGAPARAATALLERALNDEDTEVKVNAARCLVELGGK